MSKEQALRLHLGGEEVKEGWKIVNIQPKPGVDFIGSCTDLSQFADGSVTEVYASHVYEHLSYQGDLQQALKEAFRVLKKWGVLRVAVPDLEMLCKMYLIPGIPMVNRYQVMRMIMGGQIDPFDYHKTMFDFGLLAGFLQDVGFTKVNRVPTFGLFKDTSDLNVGGFLISLNVVAIKEK
jgi:predicted SAM-dependent methyltransferase